MRHPFWKSTPWASWLCVGLSGCLHGQDWRAAVSKPLTRPVADRRESLPQPKVIGPLRKEKAPFVPPTNLPTPAIVLSPPAHTSVPSVSGPRVSSSRASSLPVSHVTPRALAARPAALTASGMSGVSQIATEIIQPRTTHDEAQPRGAKVLEAEFVPPPAPPAAPPTSPLTVRPSVPQLTAEVPSVVQTVRTPQPPDGSRIVSGTALAAGIAVKNNTALPVASAIPLNVSAIGQTPTREGFAEFERTISLRNVRGAQAPAPSEADDDIVVAPEREPTTSRSLPLIIPAGTSATLIQPGVPRSLPPVSTKELPDVSDTITTVPDSPPADLEPITRPRDVAVLVEQVFEDLRQRRLDQARQRTAWLKQIVTRRESALEETSAAKQAGIATEPQRLHVDQHAVPVDKAPSEKLLDDDEFKNRP